MGELVHIETIETLAKITTIVNGTIATLLALFYITVFKDRRDRAIQDKHDFLSCTDRYARIQGVIINSKCLNALNLNIYKKKVVTEEIDNDTASKELALCGMMFQLMEDVWLMHDFPKIKGKKYKDKKFFLGWTRLFKDWMEVDAVSENWGVLKHHFSDDFIAFVDGEFLKSDRSEAGTPTVQG
jgi:hypothetical protein